MVVAIVHQAIAGYASPLTSAQRREWEKVAGRYEEVVFSPPLEQAAILIGAMLIVLVPVRRIFAHLRTYEDDVMLANTLTLMTARLFNVLATTMIALTLVLNVVFF